VSKTHEENRHKIRTVVRELKILNQYGLHARPAALFVKTASRYESDVSIEKDGNRVSGKSIMGLMTLEAGRGVKLKVTAEGPDAEEVLDELQKLVDNKFFED
jgi:phosphocarrier protein